MALDHPGQQNATTSLTQIENSASYQENQSTCVNASGKSESRTQTGCGQSGYRVKESGWTVQRIDFGIEL